MIKNLLLVQRMTFKSTNILNDNSKQDTEKINVEPFKIYFILNIPYHNFASDLYNNENFSRLDQLNFMSEP